MLKEKNEYVFHQTVIIIKIEDFNVSIFDHCPLVCTYLRYCYTNSFLFLAVGKNLYITTLFHCIHVVLVWVNKIANQFEVMFFLVFLQAVKKSSTKKKDKNVSFFESSNSSSDSEEKLKRSKKAVIKNKLSVDSDCNSSDDFESTSDYVNKFIFKL